MSDRPATRLEQIESRLREILDSVKVGRSERLDPLLDELGELVADFDPAVAKQTSPEHLERVRLLWKEAALTLATTGAGARSELLHLSTGRKTLKAYKA